MAGAEERLTGDRPVGGTDGAAPGPWLTKSDPVDERRRRRLRAEVAAAAAETAAAEAAARASAAIAAASRAAAEAETAADAAARAAEEVEAAAAAERAALAVADDATANEITTVGAPAGSRHQIGPPQAERPAPDTPAGPDPAVDDAVTVALPVIAPDPDEATTPATGGRASRRRAQEAAAEVAREATRDPETRVIPPEPGGDRPGLLRRAFRSARDQLDLRAGLTAAAVGSVLLVAGVLAAVLGGPPGPSPTAQVAATPASAAPVAPTGAAAPTGAVAPTTAPADAGSDAPADPTSPKAVAYLAALRAAGVPTSGSGEAETQAAAVICQQLAKGTEAAQLVQALPTVLPTLNSRQARSMVTVAQEKYC